MVFCPKPTLAICGPWGGGGGGGGGVVLQISSDRDDQNNGGESQNPKKYLDQNLIPKKSHSDFPSHKNFQRNYVAMIRQNYHNSSDCFEYPKKSLLKSSYSKKYVPKFSYPNKILKSKISNPTKSFDHPCHLKSGDSCEIWHLFSRTAVKNFLWCYYWWLITSLALGKCKREIILCNIYSFNNSGTRLLSTEN